MTPEEEDGFTFVDKRQTEASDADAGAKAATGTPESTEAPPGETVPDGDMPFLHQLTGRDRLLMCIDILQQGAWIAMGLRTDPVTREVKADMADARELIDCVEFLAERVRGDLDSDTQRDLRNLVRDLQVNFVQQTNR